MNLRPKGDLFPLHLLAFQVALESLSSQAPLPTSLEGDPRMVPHCQFGDVDPVVDHVFYAATEVMPVCQVLTRCAHQTPDEYLWEACTVSTLSTMPGFQEDLEHISLG